MKKICTLTSLLLGAATFAVLSALPIPLSAADSWSQVDIPDVHHSAICADLPVANEVDHPDVGAIIITTNVSAYSGRWNMSSEPGRVVHYPRSIASVGISISDGIYATTSAEIDHPDVALAMTCVLAEVKQI